MKKTVICLISLILTLTFIFSGCTPFSFLKKGTEEEPTTPEAVQSDIPVTEPFSEAVTEIPTEIAFNTESNTEAATAASTAAESTDASISTTATATVTTTVSSSPAKKQPTAKKKIPETTQKATEPVTASEKDLKNLSVKEIQDLLFETEDPNIAGKILTIAGFEYDAEQGIYYSQIDPLQRLFGFNVIYDLAAPRTGMVYSTKRIYFNYDSKDWMIQIWKGQYGITAGAEIGLYNKPEDRLIDQYDCAKDDELITMAFDFYNAGKYEFSRGPEKHWWLTGFKILQLGIGPLIDLNITLEFPNRAMSDAFEKGLKPKSAASIIDKLTYTRKGNTFKIEW